MDARSRIRILRGMSIIGAVLFLLQLLFVFLRIESFSAARFVLPVLIYLGATYELRKAVQR